VKQPSTLILLAFTAAIGLWFWWTNRSLKKKLIDNPSFLTGGQTRSQGFSAAELRARLGVLFLVLLVFLLLRFIGCY
jgi:hypothetical protein